MTLVAEAPLVEIPGEFLHEQGILLAAARDEALVPIDLMRTYLNSLSTPIPSREEETVLAKRIEAGVYAGAVLDMLAGDEISAQNNGTTRDIADLELVQIDGQSARNHLIEACQALVVSIAKRYHHPRMGLLDFIQEGNLGLIHAIEKFDYKKGYRLSSYATSWIREAIGRAIEEKAYLVRKPSEVQKAVNTLYRLEREFQEESGRKPGVEELAVVSGFTLEKVKELLTYGQDPVSLDVEVGVSESGPDVLYSFTPDPRPGPEELVVGGGKHDNHQVAMLNDWLGRLPDRQQQVVRLRFGLDDGRTRTLQEVATGIGLSRERVRQLEKTALRHLQKMALAS